MFAGRRMADCANQIPVRSVDNQGAAEMIPRRRAYRNLQECAQQISGLPPLVDHNLFWVQCRTVQTDAVYDRLDVLQQNAVVDDRAKLH